MATSDHVLRLVQKALDEFDDIPLEVSVRRAVRIANLVGDTKYAVRLSLDLNTTGGDRTTNGEISRMLMQDPSTWGSMTGPAEQAVMAWMNDRKIEGNDDNIDSHSLAELEFWDNELEDLKRTGERGDYVVDLNTRQRSTRIRARARHLTFALLCSWERRLDYSTINKSIFDGYRVKVDALLADGVPELLQQFSAVYRRLQEAANSAPERDSPKSCPRPSPHAAAFSKPSSTTCSRPVPNPLRTDTSSTTPNTAIDCRSSSKRLSPATPAGRSSRPPSQGCTSGSPPSTR
ncbi:MULTISPECIES: hypothetical protein [unclassified Streptomyces]|uniref:hypothetical protein n=1 Tax=unclassified Streptomyces TaxID=2593676 RepID=UPI000A6A967F|nr:hypothetical protein [Streptomyces sp. TSRI0281]